MRIRRPRRGRRTETIDCSFGLRSPGRNSQIGRRGPEGGNLLAKGHALAGGRPGRDYFVQRGSTSVLSLAGPRARTAVSTCRPSREVAEVAPSEGGVDHSVTVAPSVRLRLGSRPQGCRSDGGDKRSAPQRRHGCMPVLGNVRFSCWPSALSAAFCQPILQVRNNETNGNLRLLAPRCAKRVDPDAVCQAPQADPARPEPRSGKSGRTC